jgi:hypothetical protein
MVCRPWFLLWRAASFSPLVPAAARANVHAERQGIFRQFRGVLREILPPCDQCAKTRTRLDSAPVRLDVKRECAWGASEATLCQRDEARLERCEGERKLSCGASPSSPLRGEHNMSASLPRLALCENKNLLYSAQSDTPATLMTLKRTPGMSPTAWPERPKPAMRTSSLSSTKLRQPSRGTKAAIFLPFLMSCTRTALRIAELGCLASMPIFSRTMPLLIDAPAIGRLNLVLECALANVFFAQRSSLRYRLQSGRKHASERTTGL